jgi:tetratricopeptide (TPR) repeat protein
MMYMKTVSFLVIISLGITQKIFAQAQPRTEDEIAFEKAVGHFEEQYYSGAAEEFEAFLVKFPNSPLLGRAHYNLALTHFNLGNYYTAKKLFHQILDQPYNEQDENSLMEPYTLYKHHSCRQLAEIALIEKDFNAAERYIRMFDKEYPYQHFCGNEWSAYRMYKAVMQGKVHQGKGETKKAMQILLPYIFSDALASNEEVLRELSHLLEAQFTYEQNQQEFSRALATLEVKENKKNRKATIELYGVKVDVEDYFLDATTDAKVYFENKLREHELFRKFL